MRLFYCNRPESQVSMPDFFPVVEGGTSTNYASASLFRIIWIALAAGMRCHSRLHIAMREDS